MSRDCGSVFGVVQEERSSPKRGYAEEVDELASPGGACGGASNACRWEYWLRAANDWTTVNMFKHDQSNRSLLT